MPLLLRSRSAAVTNLKDPVGKKDGASTTPDNTVQPSLEQKKATNTERPKTSEGRGNSFSRPRTANAAIERTVDLQPPETIEFRSGNDTYNFPTPSPRLPPKSATFQTARVPSPLLPNGSPSIGVALGSPSQATMPKWGRSYTADHAWNRRPAVQPAPTRDPPAAPKQDDVSPLRPELKKKKSGWMSIGGLFGRKPSKLAVQDPFYQVKLPSVEGRDRQFSHDAPSPLPTEGISPRPRIHQRTPSMTRGMARFEARAEADLASFYPSSQPRKVRSPSMIQREGFSPMFRALSTQRESQDMFSASSHERNDSPLSMNEKTDGFGQQRTPRLDLDLPTPGFERYSVMFEKLLDEPKLSILERRQSKLQRKKSLKGLQPVISITEESSPTPDAQDSSATPLQRSMTSPHLTKRLSIKVNSKKDATPEDQQLTTLHRPRPIRRSKTAPPGAQSPLAAAFMKATKTVVLGLTPTSTTFSASENSLPPTPMTDTTVASDRDCLAIASSNAAAATPAPLRPAGSQHTQSEPTWDMVTSKLVDLDNTPHQQQQQQRKPHALPRVKSPADLERQIVQVSVARQVSVSKARRQVQHAVVTKQPLRPRVVELGAGGVGPNRKSAVGVVEGGD